LFRLLLFAILFPLLLSVISVMTNDLFSEMTFPMTVV
jgi:hypothetical protein